MIAEGLSIFLRMLNPVAPHITHVLWQELGYAQVHGDILDAPWPQVDPAALEQAEIETDDPGQRQAARQHHASPRMPTRPPSKPPRWPTKTVQKFVEGAPKKIIVVPGKLINIVV